MFRRLAPVALVLLASACSPTPSPADAALPHEDAGRDAPDAGFADAFVAGDAARPPSTDAGPPGPDARSAEDCATPGDEDDDRAADCDDSDCWDGCAADHVARELPGLVECREAATQSAAESLAACRGTGDLGGPATECLETITITSTARFFCDAADVVSAVWLDERLSFPPSVGRAISPTVREVTYTNAPRSSISRA